MFKVNNKDTRTAPMGSLWCLYCYLGTYFIPCSIASIVNFEQASKLFINSFQANVRFLYLLKTLERDHWHGPLTIDLLFQIFSRGRSRAAGTSKMEFFVIIVKSFQPLTIITKHSILDVAAALGPSLLMFILVGN